MIYDLPESVTLGGQEYPIFSDFRNVLEIFETLNDRRLTDEEQMKYALGDFYQDLESIPQTLIPEACSKMFWFIRGGEPERNDRRPILMSWEKDFPLIIGPVNKALGMEVREQKHLHWWTFLGAYMSLGDCLFSQIVGIRKKQAEHKKLDKWEQKFVKENPELVALKEGPKYTPAEEAFFNKFAR